jgi:hypothetical protein
VVPVRLTEEYLRIWPHAERVTLARTGHIGLVTRPDAFAAAVGSFVETHASAFAEATADRPAGRPAAREKKVG